MDTSNVKAFIFDVFGTVVDWRTSITLQCERFGETKGIERDWASFADAWRRKYRPYMDKVVTENYLGRISTRFTEWDLKTR